MNININELSKKGMLAAIESLRQKGIVVTGSYKDLTSEQHANSFTIAGITQASLLQEIKNQIVKYMESGIPIEQFKSDFVEILKKSGYIGDIDSRPHKMEFILRQNLESAYANGRYKELMAEKSMFPYWEYVTVRDNRVRPEHRLLDGIVKRYDDEFWKHLYPPNGYGCRCVVKQYKYELASANLDTSGFFRSNSDGTKSYYRSGKKVMDIPKTFDGNGISIDYDKYDYDIAKSAREFLNITKQY